jgi:hypothetical protein
MTQGKVGGQKQFWAGLAMRRLIKSSCRARSTPFYLIQCERWASQSQVQLIHLLKEVSSLTGASLFVVFAFACAMDNLCHVSTSRETSRRHVRVRSCPTNFGASLAPSAPS